MLISQLLILSNPLKVLKEILHNHLYPNLANAESTGYTIDQLSNGFKVRVTSADINASGGVLGRQLVLEVGDDACEAKQAVAVANQMANKGISFMAGHFCSSTSIPASEVYFEEGILQISPASTNPTLTERGFDNVFRTCGRDDQQGQVAGSFATGWPVSIGTQHAEAASRAVGLAGHRVPGSRQPVGAAGA